MLEITRDLLCTSQSVNVDVESIAPLRQFAPNSYDVANTTLTAEVRAPAEGYYRLVLAMETEENTSATVRIVSGDDEDFANQAKFVRIRNKDRNILLPILEKAGIPLETDVESQLAREVSHYKIADLFLPAGVHTIRIHASQKVVHVPDNPKRFEFTIYAPQLSLAPASNVKLGVTVLFPMGFAGVIDEPRVENLPGQPVPNTDAAQRVKVGIQDAWGWAFHSDPKITIGYTYP